MKATQFAIRDGGAAEAAAIVEVWRQAYSGDINLARLSGDVQRLLDGRGGVRLLVAEADGVMIGTLIVTFDGWRGNMYRLAVRPEHQRRGIATALVSEAEAWLRSIGCRRITALVAKDHDWATGFWRTAGYELEESTGRFARRLA